MRSLKVQDTIAVQDQLPSLRLAARIVWGVADQFQRIAFGERLAQELEAPLRRIEGGKRFTPEDHPDVIAEEITSLVGTSSSAEPARSRDSRSPGSDPTPRRVSGAVTTVARLGGRAAGTGAATGGH